MSRRVFYFECRYEESDLAGVDTRMVDDFVELEVRAEGLVCLRTSSGENVWRTISVYASPEDAKAHDCASSTCWNTTKDCTVVDVYSAGFEYDDQADAELVRSVKTAIIKNCVAPWKVEAEQLVQQLNYQLGEFCGLTEGVRDGR